MSVASQDNTNGRRWARFWLIVALAVSVVANVAHTVLATSDISLWLRVPGAVVWPLFTFAGIEVVVRMIWERRWTHSVTRWCILAAAVPAAITSYSHQYSLLGLMGEERHTQIIGPLAIDGFMVGLTMALLLTRPVPGQLGQIEQPTGVVVEPEDVDVDAILRKWEIENHENPMPISPASWAPTAELPLLLPTVPDEIMPTPRIPRAADPELKGRVQALIEQGFPFQVDNAAPGSSTMRKYAKVARALWNNQDAEIDYKAERVKEEIVESEIRPVMKRERVR